MDILLSSTEPTLIFHKNESEIGNIEVNNNKVIIPMIEIGKNKPDYTVVIYMLSMADKYVKAIWYDSADIKWERYIEQQGNTKVYYPSIKFEFNNPENKFEPNPYWKETLLDVVNPIMAKPYTTFIVKTNYPSGTILGQIDPNKIWNKEVDHQLIEHIETQPLPRPGEYIQLTWKMIVDTDINEADIVKVKYETPLFTGGIIKAKHNTGIDIKYDVEVFEEMIYNVMPTDFFNYKIDSWVYLLKDETLQGEHQEYGLSNITSLNSPEEQDFIKAINKLRNDNNLSALVSNRFLVNAAKGHAQDMAANNYFSHTGLDLREPLNRVTDANYFKDLPSGSTSGVGENIALYSQEQTVTTVINNWLSSPDHKANLLNPDWKEIGFSIITDANGNYYYVNDFAFRSDGINKYVATTYRIAPFNFLGIPDLQNYMGIDYPNPLQIDSALKFEEVFDMVTYKGTILKIYSQNDTADVLIGSKTYTLPIFYHCEGKTRDVNGGSSAFKIGDEVIIENPANDISFSDACVIGFPDRLELCKSGILVVYLSYHTYQRAIAISIDTMQYAIIKDTNNQNIVFPCSRNELSDALKDVILDSKSLFSIITSSTMYQENPPANILADFSKDYNITLGSGNIFTYNKSQSSTPTQSFTCGDKIHNYTANSNMSINRTHNKVVATQFPSYIDGQQSAEKLYPGLLYQISYFYKNKSFPMGFTCHINNKTINRTQFKQFGSEQYTWNHNYQSQTTNLLCNKINNYYYISYTSIQNRDSHASAILDIPNLITRQSNKYNLHSNYYVDATYNIPATHGGQNITHELNRNFIDYMYSFDGCFNNTYICYIYNKHIVEQKISCDRWNPYNITHCMDSKITSTTHDEELACYFDEFTQTSDVDIQHVNKNIQLTNLINSAKLKIKQEALQLGIPDNLMLKIDGVWIYKKG